MLREVKFRPDQKIVDTDLNNIEAFARQTFDALVANAISSQRYFTGFAITKTGQTEITVAPGHFWQGGPVFVQSVSGVFNMLTGGSWMPVVTKRKIAVVTWGTTDDVDLQDRTFVISDDGQTEPQSVAMERLRQARIGIVAGVEGPDPQKPTLDAGVIPIGWVTLSTSGVVDGSIEMAEAYRLPSVESLFQKITEFASWRAQIGQILDTILSELARIQAALPPNLIDFLRGLEQRIQDLEANARIPADTVETFVDRFVTSLYSDPEAAGYAARIDNGLQFPLGTETLGALALADPLDPKVKTVGNIMLPAWSTEGVRLEITGGDGALSINQYTTKTVGRVQKMLSRTVTSYGPWWTIMNTPANQQPPSSTFLANADIPLSGGELDAFIAAARRVSAGGSEYFEFRRDGGEVYSFAIMNPKVPGADPNWAGFSIRQVRKTKVEEPYYDLVTKDATVSGSQVAQTFLSASNGWLTSVGVEFDQVANSGDVHLFIVETQGGKPVLDRVISRGTVTAANLKAGLVRFPLEPVFTKGGRSYAVMLVSSGNHFLKVRSGNKYVSGAAFYLSDSDEWAPVQNSGDICLKLNYAQFDKTRIEVLMGPLSRVGGMDSIRITAAQFEPEGTNLTFEVQRAGKWYQISEGEFDALSGDPTLVNLRIVFSGTRDLMPGIDMTQTEYALGKSATALTHFSSSIELDSATNEVQVHCFVKGWRDDLHTLDVDLILPDPLTVNADSSQVILDPEDPTSVKIVFSFTLTADDEFVVKIIGATSDATKPFVVTSRMVFAF